MMFVCWGFAFIIIMIMALWFWHKIWGVLRMVLAVIAGLMLGVVNIILEPFKAAYRNGGIPRLLATIMGVIGVLFFLNFLFNTL